MTEDSRSDFDPKFVESVLQDIAKLFGLREEFFAHLLHEPDDWSFVIKCHALLESAVCTLISANLGRPELENVLAEDVEMSSRIEILKALNIVSEGQRKMMRSLSTLRNRIAHNVKQTNFTFAEHLTDKNRRQQFSDVFGLNWPDSIEINGRKMTRTEFVMKVPRFAVWTSVLLIAMKTMTAAAQAELNNQRRLALEGLQDVWQEANSDMPLI